MKVKIGRWEVECDVDATDENYAETQACAATTCGCPGCENYEKVRAEHFPKPLAELLVPLGVDLDKVISVRRVAPLDDKSSLYAGSFAIAGKIVQGDEDLRLECSLADIYEQVGERAHIALRKWRTPPEPWSADNCVRIRFLMVLPWMGADPFAPLDLSSCKGPADRVEK